MILCNRMELRFNRENINSDFDIFKISKERGNYFKTNILDRATQEFVAKSVVYYFGSQWFVMFKKDTIDYDAFKATITEEDSDSIINKVDILDDESLYTNVLAQLLFNTLGAPNRTSLAYNNISGRLFYFRDAYMERLPKSFYAAQLKVTKDCYIDISVKTFSCMQNVFEKVPYAKFVFDNKSKRFRKKLKQDNYDDSKVYVEKALSSKKKNTVDFLDFHNYSKFCNSKVGIYSEFVQDVKDLLYDYVDVDFGHYDDYKDFEFEDDEFEVREYGQLLREKNVCIIDDVQSEKSEMMADRIQYELLKFYGIEIVKDNVLDRAYIIRIIHNAEYYEKNKIADLHQESNTFNIVQHITEEDFRLKDDENLSPALKKVIQELIIKGDIFEKRFSIVNWKQESIWKFVKGKKLWDADTKKSYWYYYRMSIHCDGHFNIDTFDSREFTDDMDWDAIDGAYIKYDGEWRDREVEGIIYKDINNLNIIMRTEQTTMPNFVKLANALKISDRENYVSREIVLAVLKEFNEQNQKFGNSDDIKMMEDFLVAGNAPDVKISEILDIVSIRKKSMKVFNRYLFQTTGILLHPTPKDKEVRNEYFESVLDIKYFYNNDKFYYFVGIPNKNLQLSLHNACLLREVVSTGGEIFFEELLRLLAVEFVRNGQYTVVPFPFKYLNEIIRGME